MMDQNIKRFARRILLLHLALLVVLLAVVFVASWRVYRSAQDQAIEQAQREQSLVANQTVNGLKGYYDGIFSDLELLKPVNPDDEDTEDRIPADETGNSPVRTLSPLLATQLNGRVAHLFRVDRGPRNDIRPIGTQATVPTVSELVTRNRTWIDSLDKPTISPLEQFDDRQNDVVRSFTLIGIPVKLPARRGYVLVASVSARATAHRYFEDVSRDGESSALLIDNSGAIIAASTPNLIGTRIGASKDPVVASAIQHLSAKGNNGSEQLTKSFTIGAETFPPAMITALPVTVLDKQWTVLIASPLSKTDVVVRRLFGRALLWAIFLACSMTAIIVSTAIQLIRNRARMERERHQMLEKELRQAREIQLAWLPQKRARRAGLDIATVNHPASRISGDFYNWFDLPDGRTAVVIGDVTGHGMAAAFLMATTQLLVRNTMPQVIDPGRCLEEINRQLCTQVFNGQFVTLQILVFDPHNDRLEVGTAGHPSPLVNDTAKPQAAKARQPAVRAVEPEPRPPGDTFRSLPLEPNLVLGVEKDSTYQTEVFDLAGLSTVLLYTDGVLDAEAPSGDRFGLARVNRALDGNFDTAQALVDAVLGSIDSFRHRRPLADDLTLVAIQLDARPAARPASAFRQPAAAPA
jgi:serine phosphatase RsbU (regulator of sigma subunit)